MLDKSMFVFSMLSSKNKAFIIITIIMLSVPPIHECGL